MPDNSTAAATRSTLDPETAQAIKTSVLAAITSAGKPLRTTIGDTVRRSVHDALGPDFGIGRSVMKAFGTPRNLGLANVISAGAAPLSDLIPAFGIDHRALSTIKAIEPIAGAAPLHGLTAAFGTDHGARLAADTIARAAGLHNNDLGGTLRGLAVPVISASDHFAQMRSAFQPITPAASAWSDWMPDARPAIYTALPAMPDPGVWSHLSGAFTGHNSGLTHHLSALAGVGHNSFADLIRSSQRTIREAFGLPPFPHPAGWMNDLVRESTAAFAEMMRSLWPLADGGLHAARLALRAALRIVGLLERNAPHAPAAVRDFLINWLGFRHAGPDLVNSAALVLMKVASWLPDNAFIGYDPIPKLRKLTLAEHRAVNRLSTDPALQFRGAQLLSLDDSVAVSDQPGAPTVLRDLVADKEAPDPADLSDEEFTDPRFLRLWDKLTDTERAILRAKGQPGVITWASAAVDAGQRPESGESLRRKLKRLAAGEKSPSGADTQSAQAG